MSTVIAVLIVGIGSYAFRFVPLLLGSKGRSSATIDRILDGGAIAAITGLIVQDVVSTRATATTAPTIVVLLLAAWLSIKGRSMALVVGVGLVAFAIAIRVL